VLFTACAPVPGSEHMAKMFLDDMRKDINPECNITVTTVADAFSGWKQGDTQADEAELVRQATMKLETSARLLNLNE
jgi:hypothetical protein